MIFKPTIQALRSRYEFLKKERDNLLSKNYLGEFFHFDLESKIRAEMDQILGAIKDQEFAMRPSIAFYGNNGGQREVRAAHGNPYHSAIYGAIDPDFDFDGIKFSEGLLRNSELKDKILKEKSNIMSNEIVKCEECGKDVVKVPEVVGFIAYSEKNGYNLSSFRKTEDDCNFYLSQQKSGNNSFDQLSKMKADGWVVKPVKSLVHE